MGARCSGFDCAAVIEGPFVQRRQPTASALNYSSAARTLEPAHRGRRLTLRWLVGCSGTKRRPGLEPPEPGEYPRLGPSWRPVKTPPQEWEEPGKGAPHVTIMHLGRPHTGADTWDVSQHPSVSQGPRSEPSLPYQRRFGRRASTTERKKSQHFSSLLIQFFTWSDLNIYGRRCR